MLARCRAAAALPQRRDCQQAVLQNQLQQHLAAFPAPVALQEYLLHLLLQPRKRYADFAEEDEGYDDLGGDGGGEGEGGDMHRSKSGELRGGCCTGGLCERQRGHRNGVAKETKSQQIHGELQGLLRFKARMCSPPVHPCRPSLSPALAVQPPPTWCTAS